LVPGTGLVFKNADAVTRILMTRGGSHATIKWTGHPAWSEYVFLWFVTVVFGVRTGLSIWFGQWGTAMILATGLVMSGALAVFFRHTTRYTVTADAVYKTTGLFGESESSIPIAGIESVSVRQSPLDRFFGIGTIVLHLSEGKLERLAGLKDPDVVRRKIEALLTPARRASGGEPGAALLP
jgi:membrane protein YdbS with pleckstrin-like domain